MRFLPPTFRAPVRPPVAAALIAMALLGACENDSPLRLANSVPRSEAGSDRVATAGDVVVLDGSASHDGDGEELGFAWALIGGPQWVAIDDAAFAQAAVVLRVSGEYTFRLTVTDAAGTSHSDDVRVFVVEAPSTDPVNGAPVADGGGDRVALAGIEVRLDGGASVDADGDGLSFAWVQVAGPVVPIRQADRAEALITPQEPGEYEFRLIVVDGRGGSDTDRVRLLVAPNSAPPDSEPPDLRPANLSPQAHAGADHRVFAADVVRLDGSGSVDPEGTSLRYAWIQIDGPEAIGIRGADGTTASVTPMIPGEYHFLLTVTDAQGASAVATVLVEVEARVGQIEVEGVFGSAEANG